MCISLHGWPHLVKRDTTVSLKGVCYHGNGWDLGSYLAYWKRALLLTIGKGVEVSRDVGGAGSMVVVVVCQSARFLY